MRPGWLLLLSAVGMLIGAVGGLRSARFWLMASLGGAVVGLIAAVSILVSGEVWDWQGTFELGGESVHLRLDSLSAFFLALLSVLGGTGTLYAHEYWTDREHPVSAPSGRAWWNGLLVSMGLVLLCVNGLHFLIAWEAFAVCGYFLITRERHRREVRAAGWLYVG